MQEMIPLGLSAPGGKFVVRYCRLLFCSVLLCFLSVTLLIPSVVTGQENQISGQREVIAVMPRQFPPNLFVDENGNAAGFGIDVFDAIAERAELKVSYLVVDTWAEVEEVMRSGLGDVVPNMGITTQRQEWVDFCDPYEAFSVGIFVRDSTDDIRGIDDLLTRETAAVEMNSAVQILVDQNIPVSVHRDLQGAFLALLAGEVDALAYPEPIVEKMARDAGLESRIKIVGAPLAEIKRSVAVQKRDVELVAVVNQAIADFVPSDDYAAIYSKWFGVSESRSFWTAARVFWIMVGVLAATVFLLIVWRFWSLMSVNRRLRRTVDEKQRTQEALSQSEQRYALAQRGANIGSWDWNILTGEIQWSEQIEPMFGFSPGGFGGTYAAFLESVHPDDRKYVEDSLSATLTRDEEYNIDHRIVWPDATMRWVAETGDVIRDGDGKAVRMLGIVQDVTQRKLAESELQQRERFLNSLIDQNPYAMWISDDKGYLIRINDACCRLLHIQEDEVMGKYNIFEDSIVTAQGFLPLVNNVFVQGETARFTIDYDSSQLTTLGLEESVHVILEVTVAPVRGDHGDITNAIIMHSDITRQTLAEDALKRSRASLAQAQALSHVGSWDWEIETGEVVWSDEMYRILGLEPGHVSPSVDLASKYVHPDDRDAYQRALQNAVSAGQSFSIEHRIIRNDGAERNVRSLGTLILDDSGMTIGMRGTVQDISDVKLAEKALRESEERWRSLTQNSPDHILILDAQLLVEFVNFTSPGFVREDVIGKPIYDYVGDESRAEVRQILETVLQTGVPATYSTDFIPPDGERIIYETLAVPRKDRERNIGLILSARDITRRRQIEEELKQYSEKLEDMVEERTKELSRAQDRLLAQERLATLGQLAGSISHEIRNPLGVIGSSVYYLSRSKSDCFDAVTLEHLRRMNDSVRYANDIIESLLNLTRMDEPRRERLDMAEVITGAVAVAKVPQSVTIVRHDPAEPVLAKVDRAQFQMAFRNIIKNAVQAMEDQGELTISLARNGEGDVVVSFTDTGPGVSPQNINRVFEPFFSTKAKGIGFGLPIAKLITEKHQGRIEARSEPAGGTTIVMTFPSLLEGG